MKKDFGFLIFALGIFLIAILQINNANALSPSYCCEKTTQGAWCQNVPDISQCDTSNSLRAVPTSCDATSYCKPGTCVNTQEGICMENTPQRVCEDPASGKTAGKWYDAAVNSVPQCTLGCCLIGEQAAFTTQTRCKQLSSLYGLETNYRTDINTESACIASANPDVKGACVFEANSEKTCKFGTRTECQALEKAGGNSNVTFYGGFLCSAEELGTNCGPSKQTTVLDGKDEVYFLDTCGNQGNIYDSAMQNQKKYWDKIISKADSCTLTNSNSASCGNCNYILGSVGKSYDRSLDSKAPDFGNNICRNLDCNFNGQTYKHGESWCAASDGTSSINVQNGNIANKNVNNAKENLPGSRYFREVCYNGEVTIEPCADFRQEVCVQSSVGDFKTAACHVNKWQDCASQTNQNDCQDSSVRDCAWTNNQCVPKYAPGFDFWSGTSDAGQICSQASATCTVKLERGLSGSVGAVLGGAAKLVGGAGAEWTCAGNCDCIGLKKGDPVSSDDLKNPNTDWAKSHSNVCSALGDCGVKINFVNQQGNLILGRLFSGG